MCSPASSAKGSAMPKSDILARNVAAGETAPIARPEWVILSSASCPWRDSFKIEHHRRPAHETSEIVLPETNVHFFSDKMKGPCLIEWRLAGSSLKRRSIQPGDIGIMAKDTPISGRCFAPSDVLIVSFSSDLLGAAAADSISGARFELQGLQHTRDRKIRAIVSLLETEMKAGCPTGRLYGEFLGMALAVHLLRQFTVRSSITTDYRGGLPKYRLRHVVDYMQANLSEDNSLEALADLAEVSPFHFCRSFKQSTGQSPHRYILQLRIEEAKRLLKRTTLAISDVANRLGFSDQSHFTMVFRKFVGTTPARWRADV
jgi:AraC family transcriptional regulator